MDVTLLWVSATVKNLRKNETFTFDPISQKLIFN